MLYSADEGKVDVEIAIENDSAWATQAGMAKIFDIDVSGITKHLKNVFDSGELDKSSNVQKMHIAKSTKPVDFYSLDAIISVGYRVNSLKATQFRIWATDVLKQYIADGFVINEARLREDPEQLNKLAVKIRELRANEKNVFASVRECFKIAASDYEPSSKEVRKFYILLQDKFHHAVTNMTASKLKLDRANYADANMGIVSMDGNIPTKQEARVGKSYLKEDELYRLYLLSEQFLLYAESTALRGDNMTMVQLHNQLDNLLTLNGYPVFSGYKDYLKDEANAHVEREYKNFIEIKKLESLGITVDPVMFEIGEYDEYKEQTNQITMQKLNQVLEDIKTLGSDDVKPELTDFNKKLVTALAFNPKD